MTTRRRPQLSTGIKGVPATTRARLDPSDRNRREQATRYGLTAEELDALGDSCAICGFTGPLVVDHDHAAAERHGHPAGRACGACVRGKLCDYCNTGLGKFGDDPERLRAAADFLERALLRTLMLEGRS